MSATLISWLVAIGVFGLGFFFVWLENRSK